MLIGWVLPGLGAKEKSADGLGGVSGLCKLLREWPIECDRVCPLVPQEGR